MALDGNAVTKYFHRDVQDLAFRLFDLFEPVSAYLQTHVDENPDQKLSLPERSDRFTDIYNMVSCAAWLSICVRLHPEPIIIQLADHGDVFDSDIHECVNYDEYCERKAKVLEYRFNESGKQLGEIARSEEQALRAVEEEYDRRLTQMEEQTTQTAAQRELYIQTHKWKFYEWNGENLKDNEFFKERESLIKTAVWPSINIYKPGDGKRGGEHNGLRIYTIQKSQVACHWVVPRDKRSFTFSLDAWMESKQTQRAISDYNNDILRIGAQDA